MKLRFIIVNIVIILVLVIVALIGVGLYFYNFTLKPVDAGESSLTKLASIERLKETQAVNIVSRDGLKLTGYETKAEEESDVWVINIHGHKGKAESMSLYAEEFLSRGYNVLSVDLRGHGESDGDYIGMGYDEHYDILEWINYITSQEPDCKIMLFGVSMGAATVMMTTGENLPEQVKLAIEDCGYTSATEEFKYQLKQMYNLPAFPIVNVADMICSLKAGYSFKQAAPIEYVKKSKTPTLFIHGDEDTYVPFYMLDQVYEAASCEKEKLVIKGAEHVEAATTDPELYWETVDRFIEKYINR